MTDNENINLGWASLAVFLNRLGLPPVVRDRVVEIDRILADELASDEPDADGCADLVLEAADLVSDANPPGFDWSGRAAEDDPGDVDRFDFEAIEWGEE